MTNTNSENIKSICTSYEDLIKSKDFIKGLEIILNDVKIFNNKQILSLFTKLGNNEILEDNEKEQLLLFINNDIVERKGQELLSYLSNGSVKINSNVDNLLGFSEILKTIFSKEGYKKISQHILNIAKITESTLNCNNDDFKKIQIEINGEQKDILIQKHNFRVDSSNWEQINFGGDFVKINPEGDIIEIVEIRPHDHIAEKGEQLFTYTAVLREIQNTGMRLPSKEEFEAIIEKIGVSEFLTKLPGWRRLLESDLSNVGNRVYFLTNSLDHKRKYIAKFYGRSREMEFGKINHWLLGTSLRLIKES